MNFLLECCGICFLFSLNDGLQAVFAWRYMQMGLLNIARASDFLCIFHTWLQVWKLLTLEVTDLLVPKI